MFYYLLVTLLCWSVADGWSDNKQRRFKDDFLFGTASAAYQVEGAWDVDGKSESIWDRFVHSRPLSPDGDVACDSYHQVSRDVQMLRELGVDFYRFSVAWTRVLPTGFPDKINEEGLQYYENLIDELLKYNIQPMVTLYHFDLPQSLQDLGGWANPFSVQWFEDYAKVIFENFASKVPYFITINQPNSVCVDGYGGGDFAPGIKSFGVGDYLCVKNVMLAHARAYRLYEREFKEKYHGSVGIALSVNWAEPINNQTKNVEAAEVAREFSIGLYASPIWSPEGDFPAIVKDRIAAKSKEQGFSTSRLPSLTPEEKTLLKGSSDFLGMNHYTTGQAFPSTTQYPIPSFLDDMSVDFTQSSDWVQGASPWLKSAPFGLYKSCLYLNKQYNYPPIIITEHGWSTTLGRKDPSRVDNLKGYLQALLFAIEDGTDVRGYTAWSLMDNVEWAAGTSERFGLYEVDFESPNRNRSPRVSAHVYKRIIEQRFVEDAWMPTSLKMELSTRRTGKDKSEL